jgi:hypothetical protein
VDEREGTVADYIIPSSPVVTADWASLLDVGEIILSKEDAARPPKSTARLDGGEYELRGVVEVFHQLHCLVGGEGCLFRDNTRTLAVRN